MNKEINVLHIIDHLGLGGAQSVIKGINKIKKNTGITIKIYSLRHSDLERVDNYPNVQIYSSASKYSLKPILSIRKFLRNDEIDIIHCHLFRSQVVGWLLKIIFFPSIYLIYHEHGTILRDNFSSNLFYKLSKKFVDLFIAVSIITKEKLISEANIEENKIEVLPNYVDLKRFNRGRVTWAVDKERANLGITGEKFIVGFAGRIIKMKGWRILLSAAKILKEKKDINFLVAGEGNQSDEMIDVIKYFGLEENVTYLGFIDDMVWFYSLLDCFVMPSWWEAMGISVLESMAMGVPVIASNVPALNEIVIDRLNGLLFNSTDYVDLAEKIYALAENPNLSSAITKQGLNTANCYNFVRYKTRLINIYKSILGD